MKPFAICQNIIQNISSLIQSNEFLEAHRMKNRFVRCSGKLSMLHIIVYLFYTTKQAIHINSDNIRFDLPEFEFPNVTKQAISKARQGILPSLFQALFSLSVELFYQSIDYRKKWKDKYNVFAVDGSRFCIPNSKSNFENYGEMFSMKNPNRRWSMALCSTVYDVCNDYIIHGLIRPYLGSERGAALQHCSDLEDLNLFKDSFIIFDRGYFSDAMFRYFAGKGYLCVMRLKEGMKLAKQCNGDCILTLPGDKDRSTSDIKVRVISVPLDSGVTEYLATNLLDNTLSAQDFKDLYFLRWPIESKYSELKNQFLLEEFSGATSTSVEQEFFLNLLLSNLASLIKNDADEKIKEKARSTNRFRYQANRAYIIGRLKWYLPRFLAKTFTLDALDDILEGACVNKSQIQPGRKCKRNIRKSDRERKHFNNRKRAL